MAPSDRAPLRRAGAAEGSTHIRGRALLAIAALGLAACAGAAPESEVAVPPDDPALIFFAPELDIDLASFQRTPSGLYLQEVQEGEGPVARRTSRVWIEYVGWLPDGSIFDGNVGGDPYHLRLGGNEVIRGWNEGIDGMKRGGIRKLVVPPHLGYGSRGRGDVPPGSTMVFLIELVDVD